MVLDTAAKAALKKQINFYFSDSNYPRDKFMRAHASKNDEGYIPLEVFLLFNKIKTFSATEADILEACTESEELAVSEDKKSVRRIAPLPATDTTLERTIFTKGVPADTTTEQLSEALKEYGKVLSVRFLKPSKKDAAKKTEKTNKPEGEVKEETEKTDKPESEVKEETEKTDLGCFIELEDDAKAKAIVEATTKPKVSGVELTDVKSKDAFLKELKTKRKSSSKTDSDEPSAKKAKKEGKEEEEFSWTKGVLTHITGVPADTKRFDITAALEPRFGKPAFVEFDTENTAGIVRWHSAEAATAAVEGSAKEEVKIKDTKIELTAVTGKEEEEYWEKIRGLMKEKGKGGRGGGRGGRGGRGGGRGGRGGKRGRK